MSARMAYVAITVVVLVLTWTVDIFSIIAFANRAFAAYYAIQCGLAAWLSKAATRLSRLKLQLYGRLAGFGRGGAGQAGGVVVVSTKRIESADCLRIVKCSQGFK
ncbi:MAG: hypothetical protein R3F01_11780 [Lysobacteraceae bacterium]